MIRKLAASSLIAAGLVSVSALAQQTHPEIPPPTPDPAVERPVEKATPPEKAQPQTQQPEKAQPQTQQPAAPAPAAAAISPLDRRFIEDVSHANVEEIKLGEIAKSHAQNDDVRKFAQKMIDDHTKAQEDLKTLADQKGIALPNAPAPTEASLETRLSKLNGPAFDKEYITQMMNDHRKDVAEFQRESQAAKDPDVKAFAQKLLPVLQDHEKAVTDLHKQEQAPTAPPAQGAPRPGAPMKTPPTTPPPAAK